MSDISYIVPGPKTVSIGAEALDRLLSARSGPAALLYLYLLKTGGGVSPREAGRALGMSDIETESTAALLGKLGLIRGDTEPPAESGRKSENEPLSRDETPEYTAVDIKNAISRGGEFASLVREAQRCLGKILSSDDLIKLFGIYDNLGLPPEVVLQLINYCISENRRRYGEGKLPTMRYIEKAAYSWERAGVFSLDLAEQYIKERESLGDAVSGIKKALQISGRALSATERRYVEDWISLGFGPDAVELAYDRTLVKTGKLAWGYLNSILNSWHGKGLHAPSEIERGDRRSAPIQAKNGKRPSEAAPAPTEEDFNRMKKFLDELRENNDVS